MFETELCICIKMDLGLITYNGWCAITPNKTKHNLLILKRNTECLYALSDCPWQWIWLTCRDHFQLWIFPTNPCYFLVKTNRGTNRGTFLYWGTFVIAIGLIQQFPNSLHWLARNTVKSSYLNFRSECQEGYILFPNFWQSELYHGAALRTDSGEIILVCCTIDQTSTKKCAFAKLKLW